MTRPMAATTNAVPHPGTQEAIAQGCTCPVLDNQHGLGVPMPHGGRGYWMKSGCPIHAPGPSNLPSALPPVDEA